MIFCNTENCCCFNLKTGTIVIAVMQLIGCFINIFFEIFSENKSGPILASSVIFLVLCSLLIFGAHKERPNFFLPWLIVTFLGIVMMFIGLIYIFVSFFRSDADQLTYRTSNLKNKEDLRLDVFFLINLIGFSEFFVRLEICI